MLIIMISILVAIITAAILYLATNDDWEEDNNDEIK